ncbi:MULTISPECIES: aminopeptidase P family protein [Niastella]|uniref:Xaa-Pro aminopeptidase n=1 Tax=Niastella soli TaxID=2821487 RepID=A0ABS3YMQ9_9BACT|nr:aminopeptidase P family protein [Niastella soli]MBO9198882.1 aminopeptidase P family protein [Niastella soli]
MNQPIFDQSVYVQRRRQLQSKLSNGLVLLLGNEDSSMNYKDNCYPFRQDSTFLYYIGIDLPGMAVIFDLDENKEILFGENASIDDIIWTGPQPQVQELAEQVGIATSDNLAQLANLLAAARQAQRPIHILPPYRPENKIKLAAWLNCSIEQLHQFVSEPLVRSVISQREIKSAQEIQEMDKACTISADMHLAAIQYARPGMKEYELAAEVEAIALANYGRLSYPTILTINGQTLHNHFHGNTMQEGHMVLVDAGAETTGHYAGDLTRTFPVSNKFTSRQHELYNVVLEALEHAIALLRPGIQYKEIHTQACIKLTEGLTAIGLMKGNAQEAVAAGAHTMFFQCGLGHMIGLDVHDMEDLGEPLVGYDDQLKKSKEFGWKSLRLGKALKTGFTLTVEPGIYIIPELIDRWKAEQKHTSFINYELLNDYRTFGGIRIEDNFVITDTGSKKLGKALPRKLEDIEALRKG